MKIEKLRLKDFIGIKRGLFLDEITIDFSNASGLVAFAGMNGLGKSTVLENLHPFNTLASRSGALFNHVCSRSAERELSFSYNGHQYRTLLKIDAQSGKSEGFIWKDGASEVNGKISAYAKYMTELFGSTNLFFNSVFCAQNSAKLSDMTTGQLKALFAEFLRLDRLQDHEETSKQMINIYSGKAQQIEVTLAALRKRMEGVEVTEAEIIRLSLLEAEQKDNMAKANKDLQTAQEKRGLIKEAMARNEVLCKHADEISAVIKEIEGRRAAEEKDSEAQLANLRAQYQKLSGEIAQADEILASAAAINAMEENKKTLEELIALTAELVDAFADETAKKQAEVARIEKEIAELKAQNVPAEHDKEVQRLILAISTEKQRIAAYEKQLKALDVRDPECTSKTCSFIVAALKAEKDLPEAKDRLAQHEIAKENRMAELGAMGAAIANAMFIKDAALKKAHAAAREAAQTQATKRQELATQRRELAQYQKVAEMLSALAVAASKKEDRQRAIEENKAQGQAIAEAWRVKKAELERQWLEQRGKLEALQLQIDVKASDALDVTEHEIKILANGIVGAERAIAETTGQISKLQADLAGIAEIEKQIEQAQASRFCTAGNIADWTYLRNACGKNGLQALEIDGAAPLITGYANTLLSQAFGSLYTVKFRTQDDEGKECLDIVTISEDGEEVLLDNLSGGQKTWILMALRLAMTLLSKEKSGLNFQTAFFDELDGALDPDNAQNFVSMYKSFMDVGHFDAIPFISHKPECRNMADHVLMFEAGKNPYWN